MLNSVYFSTWFIINCVHQVLYNVYPRKCLYLADLQMLMAILKLLSNTLKLYRQFNIQQFYVLPTQCIYVFCVDLRTNSDYFPIQH